MPGHISSDGAAVVMIAAAVMSRGHNVLHAIQHRSNMYIPTVTMCCALIWRKIHGKIHRNHWKRHADRE